MTTKSRPSFMDELAVKPDQQHETGKMKRAKIKHTDVEAKDIKSRRGQGGTFNYVGGGYVVNKLQELYGDEIDIVNELIPNPITVRYGGENVSVYVISCSIKTEEGIKKEIIPLTDDEKLVNLFKSLQSKVLKRVGRLHGNCFGNSLYNEKSKK